MFKREVHLVVAVLITGAVLLLVLLSALLVSNKTPPLPLFNLDAHDLKCQDGDRVAVLFDGNGGGKLVCLDEVGGE